RSAGRPGRTSAVSALVPVRRMPGGTRARARAVARARRRVTRSMQLVSESPTATLEKRCQTPPGDVLPIISVSSRCLTPFAPETSSCALGRGLRETLPLPAGDEERLLRPLRHPPVPVAEQLHQRRHEQRADDRRVEDDPRREADRELL